LGKEIHAISSVSKPASSWLAQQIIQECREACGGHGYLKSSRLSEFRNNNDPLLTFEGDNNVLIQQTSNYILNVFDEFIKSGKYIETPLECLNYLKRYNELNNKRLNSSELLNKKTLVDCFDWLLCYLSKLSYDKVQTNLKNGQILFDAKNNSQVFHSKTLSLAYIDVS
jgi:acyl-CoA oxidase